MNVPTGPDSQPRHGWKSRSPSGYISTTRCRGPPFDGTSERITDRAADEATAIPLTQFIGRLGYREDTDIPAPLFRGKFKLDQVVIHGRLHFR